MVRHCLMLLALTLISGSAAAQNIELETCTALPGTTRVLGAGERITGAMKANELHIYQVTLAVNQYAHVVVEQKGIDVVVSVRDPGGNVLFSRDSPNGKVGPEQISIKAQTAGTYQVGVCTGQTEPSGTYEIRLDGPHAPTAIDEKRLEAEALQRAGGEAFRVNRNPTTALELYKQALTKWEDLGDNQEGGYTLTAIGEMHRFQRDFTSSMSNFVQALLRLQAANDKSGQAYVQNAIAAAQRDLTYEPAKAMEHYDAVIALRTSIGDRWGEVHARNNIGYLYSRLGKNLAALDNFKGLLSLWQDLGARDQELNTRNNIATANIDLGNVSAAYQDFQDLLVACQKDKAFCTCEPEKPFCLEGSIHNGLGMIYEVWGRLSDAINEYNEAINSFSQQKEKGEPGKAKVINNLGLLLASLNDSQAALDQFQTALLLKQSPGDEALTRSNIGYVQTLMGNKAEALEQLEKALTLSQNNNERIKAYTLTRLGGAYALSSDKLKALSYYNQALDLIRAIGDSRAEAITLDKMAQLNTSMGQLAKARQLYLDAQKRSQELKYIQGEAAALYGLAQLARRERNLLQAREHIVAAIQKVESLRTSTANYRFRRTYFESRYDYYALETDIRMQIYFDLRAKNDSSGAEKELDAALFAAERARARNLLDVLMESRAEIRQAVGVDHELLKRERDQQNELSEKLELLQNMLAEKGKETQKAGLEREVRSLESSLAETQGKIREHSRQYAALTQAQPFEPAEIRKLLDEDTCILQYALGDERSYLWLITAKEILPYELPGQAAIKKAASALTEAIRVYEPRKTSDPIKHVRELRQAMPTFQLRARELSDLILARVAAKLTSKRLVIVADGDLQYIPFAALPVPNTTGSSTVKPKQEFTYLIAEHEIVYEPSASALGLLRQDRPGKATRTVAVIADPVFSKGDERVKNGPQPEKTAPPSSLEDIQLRQIFRGSGDTANGPLIRLKYSRVEAEAIKAAAPPGSFMEALDFDANRDTVLSDQLKQFRIVHLATHGILNAAHPELSGLVFSLVDKYGQPRQGFLRLNDIYNLNLPADLVVLSACETGIGKEFRSEGLLGLTRGFMYAGAERVVATLWKVNDVATSELMKRFYTYMLREGKPASVALRQAQLDMIKSGGETEAPFYWAGFVLQGEWK
ncbi:MAG: hypothetical protein V7638_2966 [Acidobacteriota bacterium]|jgi:CHAT domain-containing protein